MSSCWVTQWDGQSLGHVVGWAVVGSRSSLGSRWVTHYCAVLNEYEDCITKHSSSTAKIASQTIRMKIQITRQERDKSGNATSFPFKIKTISVI
ncbi:hypothetical protein J6590_100604 [Homalodisca vitripennis]|nr:hypothetical protein J6590_100604 [Homalodisca vitripennis]